MRRLFRSGLLAIAILGFWVVIALGNGSLARAQSDDGSGDAAAATPDAAQPDQNAASDAGSDDPDAAAAQQAQEAADAAAEALDSATEARDQLESDGASQDEIDVANRAVAKARYEKDNADAAVKAADDAANQ
ncbi:hypothetical protein [Candidatus Binatus sp.]|uniref:hypothetical protein n=2 Tax=Candidatus Binatus sp. TaxID=2811406 RepID=UPI003CC51B86